MLTLRAVLGRGLLAGAAGGLSAGLIGLAWAEPVLDRAIALEPVDPGHTEELFSRAAQKSGLVLGLVLVGLALGAMFALAYRALPPDVQARPWRRSLALGAGAFTALYLVPFARYPANPPGVGDSSTIDTRTSSYLLALALGIAVVSGGYALSRTLGRRGWDAPARHSVALTAGVAVLSVVFVLLPPATDVGEVPAGLLWDFRLRSVVLQVVLYLVLSAVFGALLERTARRPDTSALVGSGGAQPTGPARSAG